MAPLFSKVDLNKLWHDVQNEETLMCAKYGKDLFNISKVTGRKKVAQFFFDSHVYKFVKCSKRYELQTSLHKRNSLRGRHVNVLAVNISTVPSTDDNVDQ